MREILFRGKTDKGEWIEGVYYKQTSFYGDDFEAHYIISSKDDLEDNMMTFESVIPETVGQYTGLTDKNGNKIFEGDILLDHYTEENCLIIYDEGGFEIYKNNISWHCQDCEISDFEIIGNIHDNPELLEGGEK